VIANEFWTQSPYLASLHLLLLRIMVWLSHAKSIENPAETLDLTFAECEKIIRRDKTDVCKNDTAAKDIKRFLRDGIYWPYLMEKFKKKPMNLKTPVGHQKWYEHWERLVYHEPIRGVDFYCAKIRYMCKSNAKPSLAGTRRQR